MSTSFEDQLKADLRAAADDAGLVGPDPDAVLGRGRGAVRRRRAMQIGSVAAVVAVVAVGAALPWGGSEDALPATPSPSLTAPASVDLRVAENGGTDHVYQVRLTPLPDRAIRVAATELTDRTVGIGGSVSLGPDDGTPTLLTQSGQHYAVGVVPSASATKVLIRTDSDYGGYSSVVEPVSGTGWSAFAAYFEEPLQGVDPVTELLWFDEQGRPVDQDGRAGSIATVGGEDVWLSPDGMTLGSTQASTSTKDSRVLEYGTEERSFVVVVLPPNAKDITLDATPGVPTPEVSVGRFAGPDGAEGTSVAMARFEGDHLDQWPLLQRARFTQDGFASSVELVGDGSQRPSPG